MSLILFWGCEQQTLKKQLKRFVATEIVIPSSLDQVGLNNGVICHESEIPISKIIVYIDSLSCNKCKVGNLLQYDEIVNLCKQLNSKCEAVFIFSPRKQDIEELKYRLGISKTDYNVIIDSTHSFPKANPHIPADSRLHTFLLDKNGKVVLVGDPAYNNPELWELYKKTITQLIENGGTLAPL
jgi:hypothetical protein